MVRGEERSRNVEKHETEQNHSMKLKAVPSSRNSFVVGGDCNYSAASSSSCRRNSIVIVANKSKKQHESQGSESTPPRITSNVKQNLRFLKLWKVTYLHSILPSFTLICTLISTLISFNRASKTEILLLPDLQPVTGRRRWRRMRMLRTPTSIVTPPPLSTSN